MPHDDVTTNMTEQRTAIPSPYLEDRDGHPESSTTEPFSEDSDAHDESSRHSDHDTRAPSVMASAPTHFQSALRLLQAKYYDTEPRQLGLAEIVRIIRLGDFFVDEHCSKSLSIVQRAIGRYGVWGSVDIGDPSQDAPLARQLLTTLRCAKLLEKRSICDVLRLRFARILLYRYFVQLCAASKENPVETSKGRGLDSHVVDQILTVIYGPKDYSLSKGMEQKRRNSLLKHKRLGKRWVMLAKFLGSGILLVCSKDANSQMYAYHNLIDYVELI